MLFPNNKEKTNTETCQQVWTAHQELIKHRRDVHK